MISIIDYGMGNLRSVAKGIELFTKDVRIITDPRDIKDSKGIVIPGDGAFGAAMENLSNGGWIDPLKGYIADGGYCMGICLGFQILFTESEEFGNHKGLDVIPGSVVRFSDPSLKVPHMGWNRVKLYNDNKFMKGIPDESYFYFIHSFHPVLTDESWRVGTAEYGVTFPCIAGKGNLIATQFHPEKSHKWGLAIVKNFVEAACG